MVGEVCLLFRPRARLKGRMFLGVESRSFLRGLRSVEGSCNSTLQGVLGFGRGAASCVRGEGDRVGLPMSCVTMRVEQKSGVISHRVGRLNLFLCVSTIGKGGRVDHGIFVTASSNSIASGLGSMLITRKFGIC